MKTAIKQFIKTELKKGYSLPIIKQELKNKGFADDNINEAANDLVYHKSTFLSLIVIFLGLLVLDAVISGIFIFIPVLFMANLALKYSMLILIPAIIGFLNLWIINSITENETEKNVIGMLAPGVITFVLYCTIKIVGAFASVVSVVSGMNKVTAIFSSANPSALFAGISFFVLACIPFFYENIKEKNSALKWAVFAFIVCAIALITAELVTGQIMLSL